jgi:hypothetical protein
MKLKLLFILVFGVLVTLQTNAQSQKKPLQIADEFPEKISTKEDYQNAMQKGIVYSKTFTNKGSAYIKLHITDFNLAKGDFLKIYNPTTKEEYIYSEDGKIIGTNKEMISDFWTGTLWGDTIKLELYKNSNTTTYNGFNIDRVAYGHTPEKINAAFKKLDNDFFQESICSADDKEAIVCYDGTEMGRKAEAVCRLLIGGGGLCTGWLLGCDGSVMTNNHCIGSAADANNTDFLFNYQYNSCNGSVDEASDLVATSAAFVQTDATLDFTLVTLPVNPTPTYGYLSLSSVAVTAGERIYIPQHPGGRRKEIAVNTDVDPDPNGFARISGAGTGIPGSRVTYQADTEGGSSGSPVIRFADHLVVAIHNTGGCNNGSYGRSDQLINAIGANMPTCGVDDNNPSAPFVSVVSYSQPINEGTDCSFQDITLEIRIAQPASQNADVSLSVTGGTATDNIDFELLNTSVTFLANDATNQNVTLRVYNDAFVEGNETVEISLSLNANGGDAQLGALSTFNLNLVDDDYAPNNATFNLFSNDFEGDLSAFTITSGAATGDNFAIGNAASSSSASYNTSGNTTNFVFLNDDACDCDMISERIMISNPFDFTNYTNTSLNFDYNYEDDNGTYNNDFFVQVSTDNGTTWTTVGTELAVTGWTASSLDLSAYAGQNNILISFFYTDTGNWGYGAALDNINVIGQGNANIQSVVNTGNASTTSLSSTGTINVYDATSGNIMTSLSNNDNFDYGCLNTSLTRAGTGAQIYNGGNTQALVMDKSFFITSDNSNTSGNNTITFYFTEAEIAGWETAVANAGGTETRADLYAIRDSNSGPQSILPAIDIVPLTVGALGNHVTLTGTFTGVDGAYQFGTQSTLLSVEENSFNQFSIFPNPVSNYLTINAQDGKLPNTLAIHNMLGQVIFKKAVNSKADLKINTSSLSNGMYFLNITSETAGQTIKFIKK